MVVKKAYKWNIAVQSTAHAEILTHKYLGIILNSELSWADQVNYTVHKAWKALHFIMHVLKKGNSNLKRLAYISLVRLLHERSLKK